MLSRNHCYCGKAISTTYSECVCSLSYPEWNAHAPYYIVCELYDCTIFYKFLIQGQDLWGKKIIEHKMFSDFSYKYCLKHFSC